MLSIGQTNLFSPQRIDSVLVSPNNNAMDATQIIDALGGTFKVAKLCQVKPPSVSEWRKEGIPPARLMYLKVIRPDIFEEEKKKVKVA